MSYKIIGKYIKDLDFNIPNPKTFFLLSKDISNYKINIDIKSNQIKDKIIEVQTTLNLKPLKEDFEKINTKIIYSTIIELANEMNDKTEIEKIILINVPSEIYPGLRKIFVFLFENSGFKDVKISEKVDFQKLYNLRKAQ
ncbi:protein-export chaperone SecB [Pelagibacteraceae bacterium]|jgi:preprotein translocase subunit SecB|nr:protein-export chaperone SecB [Pelagibacteraceae bacterium]